jgi:hypothetical protein
MLQIRLHFGLMKSRNVHLNLLIFMNDIGSPIDHSKKSAAQKRLYGNESLAGAVAFWSCQHQCNIR